MRKLAILIVSISLLGIVLSCAMPAVADVNCLSGLSSVGAQVQETSLGDLVADAVRDAARTPIAIIAAGSLKEISISAGKIDPEDITACLQYPDDKIAVVELTGRQLLSALERSVRIQPQKNMGFLQVSGLKIKFAANSPRGERIDSVEVGNIKLDNNKKYEVAMTVPLANGAYGYFTIWGKEKQRLINDTTISGIVTNFLDTRTSIDYKATDRIVVK